MYMRIGYVGLGRMGKNMVLHLLEQGAEVVAWNRSPEPLKEVEQAGATPATDLADLVNKLEIATDPSGPRNDGGGRIIWLMLPAGEVTDEFIDKLLPLLKPQDLLIDGGNSFYKDTLRRAEKIKQTGVHFMDIGTSGGPGGARNGACLMIGGEREDYEKILDLIKAISAPEAYKYLGKAGAGHFVKMVHNGIEYGMMEAIAEGFAILKSSDFKINLMDAADIYQHRSVVESRLVGWLQDALKEDPQLSDISSKIGSTGEGEWTANTAQELGVDARVIKDSFLIRQESESIEENSPDGFRNKVTSAMRGQFGGHAVRKT